MIHREITDPMYRTLIDLVVDCDIGRYQKHLKSKNVEGFKPDKRAAGHVLNCDRGPIFCWVQDTNDRQALHHEISHIVQAVFRRRDIDYSQNNRETVSYYHGYLTNKILESLENTSWTVQKMHAIKANINVIAGLASASMAATFAVYYLIRTIQLLW